MMEALSYGIGTLIALAIFVALAFLFIADITQKKHGVLRNYPVVGHLRYFFEQLGEYFRHERLTRVETGPRGPERACMHRKTARRERRVAQANACRVAGCWECRRSGFITQDSKICF